MDRVKESMTWVVFWLKLSRLSKHISLNKIVGFSGSQVCVSHVGTTIAVMSDKDITRKGGASLNP